jgi:hypothetical protein
MHMKLKGVDCSRLGRVFSHKSECHEIWTGKEIGSLTKCAGPATVEEYFLPHSQRYQGEEGLPRHPGGK